MGSIIVTFPNYLGRLRWEGGCKYFSMTHLCPSWPRPFHRPLYERRAQLRRRCRAYAGMCNGAVFFISVPTICTVQNMPQKCSKHYHPYFQLRRLFPPQYLPIFRRKIHVQTVVKIRCTYQHACFDIPRPPYLTISLHTAKTAISVRQTKLAHHKRK